MNIKRMKRIVFGILLETLGKWSPVSSRPFGKTSRDFRYLCAKNIVNEIGTNALIEKGAILGSGVILKNNASVGINCIIPSGVTIEGDNMMGPDCRFFTVNHKYNKKKMKCEGNTDRDPIIIKSHSWLGTRCIILPGVTIGKGSIIGAGSVVTKDVPDYHLAAGNPAEIKKDLRE